MAEDESLGVSWTIPEISLGFALDKDPSESTWFILTGEHSENRAYGDLNKVPLDEVLTPVVRALTRSRAKKQREE
jgi:hypothetical protein